MILIIVMQGSMEDKKSFRVLIRDRVKALREQKPSVSSDQKPLIQSRLKEMMEKAKQSRTEKKGTSTTYSLLREKMIEQRNKLKSIIEKKETT